MQEKPCSMKNYLKFSSVKHNATLKCSQSVNKRSLRVVRICADLPPPPLSRPQGPDYRLYKSEPELTTVAEVDEGNGEDRSEHPSDREHVGGKGTVEWWCCSFSVKPGAYRSTHGGGVGGHESSEKPVKFHCAQKALLLFPPLDSRWQLCVWVTQGSL